ncbi:MAG: class I SAM-dependent methyltransferase [Phycisphaerales bacterium]
MPTPPPLPPLPPVPPATPAPNSREYWLAYFDLMAGKPPREALVKALDAFEAKDASRGRPVSRIALDVGCGEGRDTREILRRSRPTVWRVACSDPVAEAIERTIQPLLPSEKERLHGAVCTLQEMPRVYATGVPSGGAAGMVQYVDLVNASYVLPFVPPADFEGVWAWLRAIIAPGGRFAGQFFGPRDSWAGIPGRSHHTDEQVAAMLTGFDIEHMQIDDKDGHDPFGNAKHWHVYHVVARKRS